MCASEKRLGRSAVVALALLVVAAPASGQARVARADLVAALREAAAGAWSSLNEPGDPDDGGLGEGSPLAVRAPAFEFTPFFLTQFRYTVSAAPQVEGDAGDPRYGFAFRRLRPGLRVKSADGKLRLFIHAEAAFSQATLLDAWLSYQISEHVRIRVGRYHVQFDRELIAPAPYLLAADRSSLANTLDLDAANRVEGLELRIGDDTQRLFLAFHEGLGVSGTAFSAPTPDWGFTARYERMVIGEGFDPTNQFTAPRGTPRNLRLGTAVHTHHLNGQGNRFAATFDVTYRHDGFNALLILGTQAAEDRNRSPFGEPEHDGGLVLKSGTYLTEKLEVFGRTELATTSDDMHPALAVLSGGVNYYFLGHACKFTADLSVAFDGVGPAFDRRVDGLLQTFFQRRDEGDVAHFLLVTLWASMDAI